LRFMAYILEDRTAQLPRRAKYKPPTQRLKWR